MLYRDDADTKWLVNGETVLGKDTYNNKVIIIY